MSILDTFDAQRESAIREYDAALAVKARREGRAWTAACYSTKVSIAYGLDGLYGDPRADAIREELEAGAARFTPGLPVYDRDPYEVYGTPEHEAWLIEMERNEP